MSERETGVCGLKNHQPLPPALLIPLTSTHSSHLLNLLRLQPNRLIIHKDPLPLIRFRLPPPPHLRRKLLHRLPVNSLKQNPRRLGHTGLHTQRNAQLHRVRVAEFQVNELLAGVGGRDGRGGGFDGGAVADADEAENAHVAGGDAGDGVLEEGAGCSCSVGGCQLKILMLARVSSLFLSTREAGIITPTETETERALDTSERIPKADGDNNGKEILTPHSPLVFLIRILHADVDFLGRFVMFGFQVRWERHGQLSCAEHHHKVSHGHIEHANT